MLRLTRIRHLRKSQGYPVSRWCWGLRSRRLSNHRYSSSRGRLQRQLGQFDAGPVIECSQGGAVRCCVNGSAPHQPIVASRVQPLRVQPQLRTFPGTSAMQQSSYTMTSCIAQHAEQANAVLLSSALSKLSLMPCPTWRVRCMPRKGERAPCEKVCS